MWWSLFLLILMGQSSFITCHLYEYHFIERNMTWVKAQNYCREEYTDLATVYDWTDVNRLRENHKKVDAWIGLQNMSGQDKTWHWSLPGVEFREEQWHVGEPNNIDSENCGVILNHKWINDPCSRIYPFICYNDTKQPNQKFHLINSTMSWPQAQKYCRENHTDLVSGVNQLNDKEFKRINESQKVWIGLFSDNWRWSDGSSSSFRNWNQESLRDGDDRKCAVTVSDGSGKWSSVDCDEEKNFFCYQDKMILIQQNMSWDEALDYCRENHNDLVSITNPNEQIWVQEKAKEASTPFVWLGLRYTCTLDFWFWVSDEVVSFKNWASDGRSDDCDMSGAMKRGGGYKWYKKNDADKFNLICSKF